MSYSFYNLNLLFFQKLMEDNNIPTKKINPTAEKLFIFIGLILLLAVPFIYSQNPPGGSAILQHHSTPETAVSSLPIASN